MSYPQCKVLLTPTTKGKTMGYNEVEFGGFNCDSCGLEDADVTAEIIDERIIQWDCPKCEETHSKEYNPMDFVDEDVWRNR